MFFRYGVLGSLMFFMCAEAFGDIRNTAHGLFRSGTPTPKTESEDASEICVFCHTPFIGNAPPQVAPAWQNAVAGTYSYTMYDDIGRLQYGDKPAVGSQSIACLSCHDANQAFSVTALTFDHPFGVPYRGYANRHPGQADGSNPETKGGAVAAKNLISTEDFREPSQGVVDSRVVWWVSSTGNGNLRTRSDLPLYVRGDEDGQGIPYIECTSCHNPHSDNRLFLRLGNEGGQLCMTCHNK